MNRSDDSAVRGAYELLRQGREVRAPAAAFDRITAAARDARAESEPSEHARLWRAAAAFLIGVGLFTALAWTARSSRRGDEGRGEFSPIDASAQMVRGVHAPFADTPEFQLLAALDAKRRR